MRSATVNARMTTDEKNLLLSATPNLTLSEAIRQAIALYIRSKNK